MPNPDSSIVAYPRSTFNNQPVSGSDPYTSALLYITEHENNNDVITYKQVDTVLKSISPFIFSNATNNDINTLVALTNNMSIYADDKLEFAYELLMSDAANNNAIADARIVSFIIENTELKAKLKKAKTITITAAIAETIMNKQMVSEVASKVTATQTTSSTKVAESSLNAQAKPFIPVQVKHETLMKRDVVAEKQVAMKEVKQSETKIIEHELKSSTALNSTDSKLAEKKAKHDVKAVEKKIEAEHKAVAKQETVMKRDMAAEMNVKPFVSMHKSEHKEKVEAKSTMPAFFADSKWMGDGKNYFKVKAGVAQPTRSLGGSTGIDSRPPATYVVGATLGREFMEGFSADLEYMHRGESKASFKDAFTGGIKPNTRAWNLRSDSILLNVNMDLTHGSNITPYIRVGGGVSANRPNTYTRTDPFGGVYTISAKNTNEFAWQAGLGMNFTFNPTIGTELEYVYVDRGKFKTNDTELGSDSPLSGKTKSCSLNDHVVTFGVKVKF